LSQLETILTAISASLPSLPEANTLALVPAFIRFGFFELRFIDVLDILLVGFLLYQLYRIIRGSLAYSIFVGFLIVYLLSLLFRALNMQLISQIMGQFISVGVLALLIVFQPEVRRFLLYIGRGSELQRSRFFRRFSLRRLGRGIQDEDPAFLPSLEASLLKMARKKTGVLLVFSQTSRLQFFADTGVKLDAEVSGKLLETIFQKSSPLHDGAVIIADHRIVAAACILPVSETSELPGQLGLRHRAAVGITEHSDATALVISEEKGKISFARSGLLRLDISEEELGQLLRETWSAPFRD